MKPSIIVIMGVSGSGKSTIAKRLSADLDIPFFDADDFHPKSNIRKMSEGGALNDMDRQPWLNTLHHLLVEQSESKGAILACSALKESYRSTLSNHLDITWVYLKGDVDLILARMKARKHFMPESLLTSQFEDLEEPDYGITITIDEEPHQIIQTIKEKMSQTRTF